MKAIVEERVSAIGGSLPAAGRRLRRKGEGEGKVIPMSDTMKAILIHEYGGPEKLILTTVPRPYPRREGDVLVRIRAAGVNPVDWKIREGRLKDRLPNHFPIILGWDMAGVVEERGYSARRFQAGDPVYAYCRRTAIHHGTYAQYISLPESYLSLKPKNISFEKAAAIPLAGLTAFQALFDRAQLKRGEKILILGASGGVGSFAVQFAKIAGAKIIAVASRPNHRYLKNLGAHHTIDYLHRDFSKELLALHPQGVDVVLACVGGDNLLKSYDCVRKGGRLVTIVEKGHENLARSKRIALLYHFVEPNSRQLDQIREWVEKDKMRVNLAKIFSLKEAVAAHEAIETGHIRGKIVLRIDAST